MSIAPLFEKIDLNNHGIIEASAGTGKTYTIQNFIIRLLKDSFQKFENNKVRAPLSIEELLIVTYTEKAAGELKTRIREAVEKELRIAQAGANNSNENYREYLRLTLSELQQANISTIHGFCKKIISTYPFECNTTLKQDIISDNEGLKKEVFLRIKNHWKKDYAKFIDEFDLLIQNDFMESIIKVAQEVVIGDSTFMPSTDSLETLILSRENHTNSLIESASIFLEKIETLKKEIQSDPSICIELETVQKALNQCVIELKNITDRKFPSSLTLTASAFKNARSIPFKFFEKSLRPAIKDEFGDLYSELHVLFNELSAINNDVFNEFIGREAFLIKESWQIKKAQLGGLSFNDIIKLVRDALCLENSLLKTELVQQFKFGIIDEFQDTNTYQWDIFRQLFLEDNSKKERLLYLVGDPKQSIYSFQGADVETYNKAKKLIAEKYLGASYVLDHNFRSTPQMISAYNAAFENGKSSEKVKSKTVVKDANWFLSDDISYDQPVKAGLEESVLYRADDSSTDSQAIGQDLLNNALTIFESNQKSIGEIRSEYAKWAINKINTIIVDSETSPILKRVSDNPEKYEPLSYGDIVFLVRSKSQAKAFTKELAKAEIPYSFYKQEGIFQSEDCFHFITLLKAILDFGNQDSNIKAALLTPFFNWNLYDVAHIDRLQDKRGHYEIFEPLKVYSEKSNWVGLINYLFEKTNIELTLPLLEDGVRRLSNIRQISEYFLKITREKAGGLRDYILLFEALYANEASVGDDENLYAKETESNCVQIMTMHSSKGLEFPIVFVLPQDQYSLIGNVHCLNDHNNQDSLKQIWHTKSSQFPKDEFKLKGNQENARLNYVAFTRAGCKLFVPLLKAKSELKLTLEGLIESNQSNFISTESLQKQEELNLIVKKSLQSDISSDDLDNELITASDSVTQFRSQLNQQKMALTSYSALVHSQMAQHSDQGREDKNEEVQLLDLVALSDSKNEIYVYDSLPKGAASGNAIHEILEVIDYDQMRPFISIKNIEEVTLDSIPKSIAALIEARLNANGILSYNNAEFQIRQTFLMISQVLGSQIFSDEKILELIDLKTIDRKEEAEFHFSFDRQGLPFPKNTDNIAGYVLGYIDLTFRVKLADGSYKYHVLDWKSNTLSNYDHPHLDKAMKDSGYDLQAKLYTLALDQWLQASLKEKYDRKKHLGLPCYAFVRGNQTQSTLGMWKPEDDKEWTIEQITKDISSLIQSGKTIHSLLKLEEN